MIESENYIELKYSRVSEWSARAASHRCSLRDFEVESFKAKDGPDGVHSRSTKEKGCALVAAE